MGDGKSSYISSSKIYTRDVPRHKHVMHTIKSGCMLALQKRKHKVGKMMSGSPINDRVKKGNHDEQPNHQGLSEEGKLRIHSERGRHSQ
jgi:hypothetical protein